MICFVDIEHEKCLQDPDRRSSHLSYCMDVKLKLEEISGTPCLVQRFTDVTRQQLRDLGITALAISGNVTEWPKYDDQDLAEMRHLIREAEWPIIGFCGGHQLIAIAHAAPVEPMRRLRPGEADVTSLSGPGYLKEWGFMPLKAVKTDPIFDGLGQSPVFLELHYWEIKQPPPGFEVLASSDECRIQVMKQVDKPVYGVQFHPEGYTEGPYDRRNRLVNLAYPDGYAQEQSAGRELLANFFQIAGILK